MKQSFVEDEFATGEQRKEIYLKYDVRGNLIEDEYDDSNLIVAKMTKTTDKDGRETRIYKIAELNGAVFDPRSGNYSASARKFWSDFKFRKVKPIIFEKYLRYLNENKSSLYAEVARGYLDD